MNALQLEEHIGRRNTYYDTTCKLCGEEQEDLVNFTVKCSKLERKRDPTLIDKEIKNPVERMKELLFRNREHIKVSQLVRNLWILRRDLLKEIKEGKTPGNQTQAKKI